MAIEALNELPESTSLPAPTLLKENAEGWAKDATARLGDDYAKIVRALQGASGGLDAHDTRIVALETNSFGPWLVRSETVAGMYGGASMKSVAPLTNNGLKLYLASVAGGQRVSIWDDAVALPLVPHTGIFPAFAVHGDIVAGDIVAIASNPMTYFIRANLGLPVSAVTQLFSARAVNADTDGGAGIILTPLLNAGGVVNDGNLRLVAYGKGTGALANAIRLATRSGIDTATDRWVILSAGHLRPDAVNTYDLGQSGAPVRELYLGAGTSTVTVGKPSRWILRGTGSVTGSPGNTNENDLKSFSVPANTLAVNGDTLHFVAVFRCAVNDTTRRIRVKYGVTTLIDSTAIIMNDSRVVIEGWVTRTGAATQTAYVKATRAAQNQSWISTLGGGVDTAFPAETLSGAVTLKTTVQLGGGAALNDVIQDDFWVEYVPA